LSANLEKCKPGIARLFTPCFSDPPQMMMEVITVSERNGDNYQINPVKPDKFFLRKNLLKNGVSGEQGGKDQVLAKLSPGRFDNFQKIFDWMYNVASFMLRLEAL
jgi:hypothetical protein